MLLVHLGRPAMIVRCGCRWALAVGARSDAPTASRWVARCRRSSRSGNGSGGLVSSWPWIALLGGWPGPFSVPPLIAPATGDVDPRRGLDRDPLMPGCGDRSSASKPSVGRDLVQQRLIKPWRRRSRRKAHEGGAFRRGPHADSHRSSQAAVSSPRLAMSRGSARAGV